jgi:hypothetical protein
MAAHIYKTKDGGRVPSVTTILKKFKSSDALIHWAWKLGMDGKDYRSERQKAADAGTVAHQMVETHIKGEIWQDTGDFAPNVIAKGRKAFENYLRWSEGSKIEILYTEVPLVSEIHRYGGCLDAVGICHSMSAANALADWKSSKALYADYLYQIAGYRVLWNENYPDTPIEGGFHLCRFDKENGDFEHRYFPNLDNEEEAFLLMRKLYDKTAKAERRLKDAA